MALRNALHIKEIFSRIQRFIWDEFCIVCNAPGNFVCATCTSHLPFVNGSCCTICGVPFPHLGDGVSPVSAHPCGDCLKKNPHYDKHRALMSYTGVAKDLVHALKYHGEFWIRRYYTSCLDRIKNKFTDTDVIMPLPLHNQRLRERGFNQSQLLAEAWRDGLHKPILLKTLVRSKNTAPQTGFDREVRLKNLRGAFAVNDRDAIKGKTILLVDDVHTTGSTLSMASFALKRAGAEKVCATTLAVVPLHGERI